MFCGNQRIFLVILSQSDFVKTAIRYDVTNEANRRKFEKTVNRL